MARKPKDWTLYTDPRTGHRIVRFTHAGRRFYISTRESHLGKAAITAKRIYEEVTSGRWRRQRHVALACSTRPLDELGAEWLADAEAALDPTTVAQYTIYVGKWTDFFRSLDRITEVSAEDYWHHRLRHVRRKTVLKELSALRGFLGWCKGRDFIDRTLVITSPPRKATGTPTKRPHKGRYFVFEESQIDALLAALPEWSSGKHRRHFPVRARFEVAWETGLRPATLDQLRAPDDYKTGNDVLIIRDEADKTRFGRDYPLRDLPRTRAALDGVCPEVGLIFGHHDYRVFLRAAALAAGFAPEVAAHVSAYDFRHSRLTNLCEHTSNLAGVAYLAGHRHVSTTSKYVRPTQRAAEQVLADASHAQTGYQTGYGVDNQEYTDAADLPKNRTKTS